MSESVFLAVLIVLQLISTVWVKVSQNSYRHEFCAQVSQIVFLADLTVFAYYYNCMSENVTKHKTPRLLCTSVTNRLLRWFDLFTTFSNCISKNVTKLIFFRYLCTKVKNRVLTWFDRFTAYYNCMSKNVGKLISPRVLCTSVKNRVLRWFNRFTTYYNCISKNVKKTLISASSRHKYHKSCS